MTLLSEWLLIVVGILIFFISFSIFYNYYSKVEESIRINKGVESFYAFYNILNKVCDSFIGEKRMFYLYYPKEMVYIYGQNKKICYKTIKSESCEELLCEVNLFNISIYNSPYIEALDKDSCKFEIIIEKVNSNMIKIDYKLKI